MRRHPNWLKVKIPGGKDFVKMKKLLRLSKLHTICEEAKCPNISECFSCGTAVFLILGNVCTRNCKYCNVKNGTPLEVNPDEPHDVAISVKQLGLDYVVITSVTRDDLDDGGACIFCKTIREIRNLTPNCKIEVLIPDFKGNVSSLKKIIDSKPEVINHNIEVVEDLFPDIRPQGDYKVSLDLLKNIKKFDNCIKSKSGFMIGLGEDKNKIIKTLEDLKSSSVDFLTIGQYLQPSKEHHKVVRYYSPEEFKELKKIGLKMGFEHVESGPLVRSSYNAKEAFS